MSAYGSSAQGGSRASASLGARVYPSPRGERKAIAFIHLPGSQLPKTWGARMYQVFQQELEDGLTYPQRGPISQDDFKSYFLAYDVVVGIFHDGITLDASAESRDGQSADAHGLIEAARENPSLIGCFYYIKPNYPGRSSHLCNAGFVVPPEHRGTGVGRLAGQSFLYFAPRLAYEGSVFNLVYASNEASLRIWDRLGFDRVGRIPGAGLLRKAGAKEEEHYVDAWVVHGDFSKLAPEAMRAAAK